MQEINDSRYHTLVADIQLGTTFPFSAKTKVNNYPKVEPNFGIYPFRCEQE
jgi:hypothetical protein